MVGNGFYNVTTNAGGVPYLSVSNVTVGTETVDLALGFRRIQPIGYLTIRLATPIPADATTTLPITLTLNGTTRNLTLYDGTPVTVENLINGGVFVVFNDRFNGILQLVSQVATA